MLAAQIDGQFERRVGGSHLLYTGGRGKCFHGNENFPRQFDVHMTKARWGMIRAIRDETIIFGECHRRQKL